MATAQGVADDLEAEVQAGPEPAVSYIDPQPNVWLAIREGWANRQVVGWLAARTLVRQYTKTKLGPAWVAARPLVDGLGRTLLFGGILSINAPNNIPYFLFLMVGMMGWMTFEQTIYWGTRSLDQQRKPAQRLRLPLVLIPIAGGVQGVVFLVSYVLIIAASIAYFALVHGALYLQLGPQLLVGILGIVLVILLAWGVNFWTSVLDARARDVRNMLRYVLPIGVYVTPVMYPISELGEPWQTIALVNPVAPMVEMAKYGFIGAADVSMLSVLWAVGITAGVLASGLWFFTRNAARTIELAASPPADRDDEEEL